MGQFSFFDYLFNICRSFSDVMHICFYLLVVVIAILVAMYKCESKFYYKHVYAPLIKFLLKKHYIEYVKIYVNGRNKNNLVLR